MNTIPMKTLDAYRDHGQPNVRLEENVEKAEFIVHQLPELGIDMDKLTQQLEQEA